MPQVDQWESLMRGTPIVDWDTRGRPHETQVLNMAPDPPQLRRRYTDQDTGEVFDVTYRDGRVVVSDGLRELAVVGRATAGYPHSPSYRLDLDSDAPLSHFGYERPETPKAALGIACDYLYKLRGSDFDPAACLEQMVRDLPRDDRD